MPKTLPALAKYSFNTCLNKVCSAKKKSTKRVKRKR